MSILWFLLTWCQTDRWLEQTRRGQLTPAERAEEDLREEANRAAEQITSLDLLKCIIAVTVFFVCGCFFLALIH